MRSSNSAAAFVFESSPPLGGEEKRDWGERDQVAHWCLVLGRVLRPFEREDRALTEIDSKSRRVRDGRVRAICAMLGSAQGAWTMEITARRRQDLRPPAPRTSGS
jgi:hypothetical protein